MRGRVTQRDGVAIAGAPVRASDVQGVAARTGVLGSTRTDENGVYKIRYRLADGARADLIVEVLASEGETVVTRSPLVVGAAPDQVVDLVVDSAAYPPASEFDQIDARLAPLLDGVRLDDVDGDSVAYLSGKTGISPIRIAEFIQAKRFANSGRVPAHIYYGMFRANLPVNRPALVAQDDALLRRAVIAASESNVIDPELAQQPEAVDSALEMLNGEMVDTIVKQPALPNGTASLGAFLDIAGLDDGDKRTVVQQVQTTKGRGDEFWSGLVERGVEAHTVESMKLAAQLSTVTMSNAPLMRTLHEKLRGRIGDGQDPLRELAGLTQDEWLGLVYEHTDDNGNVVVPEMPDKDLYADGEPAAAYAQTMRRVIEDTYPTPTLAARLTADDFDGADVLSRFLTEHPDFEFRDKSVPGYLHATAIDLPEETQRTLERVGRIFDLAPRYERYATMQPLLASGLGSAYQIRTMGERRFTRVFGETLGTATARKVYANAARKTAIASSLFARYAAGFNTLDLAVLPQRDVPGSLENLNGSDEAESSFEAIDFPTWEGLFGNIDVCDCKHCDSIFGPAAYLVAVLKFLHDRGALPALLDRRPDIENVELTCHNTNTVLPYIDLVLEVFETFLVSGDDAYQTEGEADVLRVHPEHIDAEAYRILEEDLIYPWTLPFSLWMEEARAYLEPLGVTRHEIMDHFSATPAAERDVDAWLPIATESLNLTPGLQAILFDANFDTARWNGRGVDELRTVQTLLDTARIDYLELRQLIGTRFVNADGVLEVSFAPEDDEGGLDCDLGRATIPGLGPEHLNRIGRFVRLRRALGWTVHELDAVLNALGGDIDKEALVALSFVKTLHERLDSPLLVIASWVADLDIHDYLAEDGEMAPSLYASLFLNRTIGDDDELAPFELAALGGPCIDGHGACIDEHEAAILAALQIITAEELAQIRACRLDDDLLNLDNLSELHRVATLKRALGLSVGELLALLDLSGLKPFDAAYLYDAVQLVELTAMLNTVDFDVAELVYLLLHDYSANSHIAPSDTAIARFLGGLRNDLQRIQNDYAAVPDPSGDITAQMLGNVLPEKELAATVSMIYGIAEVDVTPTDPAVFLEAQLASVVADPGERGIIVARLLDDAHPDYLQPEGEQAERFFLVLEPLAAHLRQRNSAALLQHRFAEFLDLDLDASSMLGGLLRSVANSGQPASALFLHGSFVDSTDEITPGAFGDQFAMIHRLHKVALLIHRFDLPTEELEWFVQEHATVEWLDANDLPVAEIADAGERWQQWQRMARVAALREQWPSGEPSLFELLRQAEAGGDAAAFDAFLSDLTDRTGWNRADVDTLLDAAHFGLVDFDTDWGGAATLRHLWRLHACFGILRRLGVFAAMAWEWAKPGVTRTVAGEVKQAARAKYSESQWLNVAAPIRDGLRRKQRVALVDAVIQQIDSPKVQNTNDLYAQFLMDAEMDPCMLTSRVVFVTGAVQLFVQRILLNLEAGISFTTEDEEIWQWMKNYRVWEANVRVFITPENWIEPELRPGKSPFFIELENELLQNDVTMETAEIAYQGYLERLDEVARLEVVGVYNEVETKTLHVIGRTKGTPHKFFYRQWYRSRRWTPWEVMPLDIEAEAVTPVIYNRRLYLFWFTTLEKADEETENNKRPNRYLEIRLAWSQYRQRKWAPKRISNIVVKTKKSRDLSASMLRPHSFRPRPVLRTDGNLLIAVERTGLLPTSYLDSNDLQQHSSFLFIHDAQVEPAYYGSAYDNKPFPIPVPVGAGYPLSYYWEVPWGDLGLHLVGNLGTWDNVLDSAPHTFRVTIPLQYIKYRSNAPFFFEDRHRSYLVVPHNPAGLEPMNNGDLVADFPHMLVVLDDEPSLNVPGILNPLLPPSEGAAPGVLVPSLESVLHPETRTPVVDNAVTDLIAGIDPRVLGGEPLTVVHGGQPILGGDVGVPAMWLNAEAGPEDSPSTSALVDTAIAGGSNGPVLSMGVTHAAEELYAANVAMNVGVAASVWSVYEGIFGSTIYTFYGFYHPYVGYLIKQLNRYGVEGILNPREHGEAHDLRRQLKQAPADERFDDVYELGDDIDDNLLPEEEFDFEYGRAYSMYNWELFFHIPFLIANHLTQNQRFDEARQWYRYIFDPTDNSDLADEESRYRFWKVKPFFENTDIQTIEQLMRLLSSDEPEDLEMKRRLEAQIKDWQENPFQPHIIAQQRPEAYQKAVVMKFMDNEIAQGDYLFRQDTMESVFEAIQHYLLVAEMLGKRPEQVPAHKGTRTIDGVAVRTFSDLMPHLDAFGNVLVELETRYASDSLSGDDGPDDVGAEPPVHEIIGSTLFFCIPQNEKLLGYWDTVEDRLFKIRNCMNIEGVERQLDLFAPPIDPALLVRAAAAGVSLGAVLGEMNAPKPLYRFSVVLQKAMELCNEVRSLGGALLAALEKRDAEEMALLRQTHEQNLLAAVKRIRERQVEESKEALAGLQKSLEAAEARHRFYANRNPLIPNEKLHLSRSEVANMFDNIAQGYSLVGSALALIPEFDLGAEGGFSSPVTKAQFGGANLSRVLGFYSQLYSFFASLERQGAQRAQTLAGYDRRQEEWDFSAEQARTDGEGLERQVMASEIRIAIAEQELANHETQIEQSREIDDFMRQKFTSYDLYSWMVTQLSALYFQSYQMAYDMAKRAEKAFQHELAEYDAGYVTFGYWDSLKKGLLAADRLNLDLRRMETAYYERNKRELELTKHVSLLRLDPAALVQLRETGACDFEMPEVLFNLDFPGHYLRRLKTVSLTIPGVVGPYTGVNATLTLLGNRVRVNTDDPQLPYGGIDDTRFVTNIGSIQAIATSSGREDSGMFELNLRDERYLPFEGAGAISRWRLELSSDVVVGSETYRYRAFDYDTISDVVIHLRYTARDGGLALREQVVPDLAERINTIVNATKHTGLFLFASLAHEFGNELHRFLHPQGTDDHSTTLSLGRDYFPYVFQGRQIDVQRVSLLLKLRDPSLYDDNHPLSIELARAGGDAQDTVLVTAAGLLGDLPHAEYEHVAGELDVQETWALRVPSDAFEGLPDELHQVVIVDGTDVARLRAEEFEDIGLLIHYSVN